jgi:hypothetical protein
MGRGTFAGTSPRRLGEYLREQTGLTCKQVVRALRRQVVARDQGEDKRLGEILVELGYVTPRDVDTAASRQDAEGERG